MHDWPAVLLEAVHELGKRALDTVSAAGGGRTRDDLVSDGLGSTAVSGRVMEVFTTQPGVQLYTANHLDGKLAGIGGPYGTHAALCLETQHFPDSVNHPNFPSAILHPGENFQNTTVFKFSAK